MNFLLADCCRWCYYLTCANLFVVATSLLSPNDFQQLQQQQQQRASVRASSAGPRFQSEMPSEVQLTPERGFTLDCPAWAQPTPQIAWLSSKGSGSNDAQQWSPVLADELPNLMSFNAANGSLTWHAFRPDQFRPDVHAATYQCAVANVLGRILSTPVRLRTVVVPSSFEAVVESPRVRRGGTAVFRCSVTPDSLRQHVTVTSWIQDGRYDIFLTSSSQDGRHVMLPNGELHVLAVRQGDENHLYQCRVLVRPNGQTLTSSSGGRIFLLPDSMTKTAPVIVESLGRVRVWRGQEAVLPCVFHGYPPPKIKWYRSQTVQYGNLMLPLIPTSSVQQRHPSAGNGRHRLVGGTLVIGSVVAQDQGRYVCSVNNSAGLVESSTELVFREKLQVRIVESAANQQLVVDAETPVTLTCSFSGSPRPVVTWLKDGQRYLNNAGRGTAGDAGGDVVQLHIGSVQRQDQGIYQCLASNEDGDAAQASVQLSIGAFPPHLTQTFTRQILHPGSSVSLKCLASGTPPPHFTWTLDGSPLPVSERYFLGQQQTGGGIGQEEQVVTHLNISHVRVEDGGNYKCLAENRVGRVEHSAVLHVYGPPHVRPMNGVVAVGGKRLELSCPVAGYPIDGITWEKDGRRLPLNGRQRVQQFNGSLTIDPVDKSSDAGLYSCEARAQNGLLSARQSFQLNIIDAPHMMPVSESAVLNAGERLALQCAVVKGGLPLSVSWSKDGQVLSPSLHNNGQQQQQTAATIVVRFINEFTLSLTVESLTGQHAGLYVCRAANEGGRAQVAVHVVVQAGPRITPFGMPSRTVVVHSRVQVSCVIEEGDPPFRIRWFRDDRPLLVSSVSSPVSNSLAPFRYPTATDPSTVIPAASSYSTGLRLTDFNAYSSILTIDQVTVNHGGNYSCRAENAAGAALHSALLQVSVPPLWQNGQPPPEIVQTVDGHSVELLCRVDGVPPPQVTWSFSKDKRADNGKYVSLFNNNRTLIANSSLVISPVDVSDQGFYQCEASNGVGNNINAITALQIHGPPRVQLDHDYMAVRRGSLTGTVLKCSITGDPPLNIQWRKDSVPLLLDSSDRVLTRAIPASVQQQTLLVSELSVSNAASADEGLYECAASNAYGQDADAVFLQVQDVPQPPVDVRVAATASRRIQLEWKPPVSDGGNPVQEFIIFYQATTDAAMRQERTAAVTTSGAIDKLLPATSYHVHVLAVNALGQSQPSVGLTVTTDEEAPEGPPLQLGASSVTSRGFTISWAPPVARLQNGIVHSYLVTIDSGRMVNRTVVPSLLPGSDIHQYVASALRPNTNYRVHIQAVNSQGTGPASPSLSVKTMEDAPDEAPLNVACVALNSQSLQITWQPPRAESRNGILRGYRLYYELQTDWADSADQTANGGSSQTTTELTLFLSNLQKFANYTVQVLAFTAVGDGTRSLPLTCTTKEDIPEMPSKLKVVQSGPESVCVSWLPHPRPSGRVTHYTVYSKEVERGQDVNPQKWTATGSRLDIRNLSRSARRGGSNVFYFQVAAVSGQAGEGPRSSILSFTFNPTNKIPAAVVSIGTDYLVPRWSRLILPCAALGDTPLQIGWFHDGRQLGDWFNLNPSKAGDQLQQPWIQHPSVDGDQDDGALPAHHVLANGSLSIGRLGDDGGGNYSCQARNRHGQDRVDYFLGVVTPPTAPQLRFAASNWSSVTLQWSVSPSGGDNRTRVSPVRSFALKYRPRGVEWRHKTLPAGWRSVAVDDLVCGTEYEFSLTAASRVGNSSSSNVVTARTKGSPPEYAAVADETADVALTATSCTLDLSRWRDRGCPIQQYVLRFRTADSSEWIIAGAESPPQSTFLLGGLIPAKDYAVRVTVVNAAGSTQRDYSVRTLPLLSSLDPSGGSSGASDFSLAPLFSDLRVAVPMAVSSLAILLTVVTLLLRYRYRSGDYVRPDPASQSVGNTIRTYADESGGGCDYNGDSTLGRKRPPPADPLYDVSPYAVFPSLMGSTKSQFSSSRRMKTFMVDGSASTLPLEMSNYAAPIRATNPGAGRTEEPVYDYIAPCRDTTTTTDLIGESSRQHPPKSSVFMPIIPAGHNNTLPGQQQQHHPRHLHSNHHQQYHQHHHQQQHSSDWNNQETLAMSQRL